MRVEEVQARLAAAMPANVRAVCATLAAAGHEAVTVGGAVRDAILGRAPGDWDVATSARPEDVMRLFRRTVPTGLQHGTVTIVTGQGEASHVEVTTFRGEGAYTDARRPDHVTFGVPLDEDLARRDLRVNAIAYDPASGEVRDPYGGLADLEARVLRAVGPTGDPYRDAVARFTEDGLRVMRAVRFAAVLEFALDPETERGIAEAQVLASLDRVSRERVSDELRKILAAREPSRALRAAERTGIVAHVLPAVAAGVARWGARAAVVERWLARVDAAEGADARLGALVAELADPPEREVAAVRIDRAAVARAADVLRALKFSNDELATASTLVGTLGAAARPAWEPAQVRRLLADVTRARGAAAVAFWRACGAEALASAAAEILARPAREAPLAIGELAATGKDLMSGLGIAPGPRIGALLNLLFDRALDDPSVNDRERLLALAAQLQLEVPGA